MSSFSTIATINEEKNEITAMEIMEKSLKSSGLIFTFPNKNGNAATLWVVTESFPTKFSIKISKWNESENSNGLITITITEIKV